MIWGAHFHSGRSEWLGLEPNTFRYWAEGSYQWAISLYPLSRNNIFLAKSGLKILLLIVRWFWSKLLNWVIHHHHPLLGKSCLLLSIFHNVEFWFFQASACQWLDFGLHSLYPQDMWCHWGELEPFSIILAQAGWVGRMWSARETFLWSTKPWLGIEPQRGQKFIHSFSFYDWLGSSW